jgi:hypothetical protein
MVQNAMLDRDTECPTCPATIASGRRLPHLSADVRPVLGHGREHPWRWAATTLVATKVWANSVDAGNELSTRLKIPQKR